MLILIFRYHWIWFIAGLLIILALVWMTYGKPSAFFNTGKRRVLAVLRFLSLLLILLLLLKPQLRRTVQEADKPVVAIAVDQSRSMLLHGDEDRIKRDYNAWKARLESQLGNRFAFDFIGFDEGVFPFDTLDFRGGETDISSVFRYVKKRYPREKLKAVVLHSDGIYTTGTRPSMLAGSLDVPVFTVVYGDTVNKPDAAVERVMHNAFVYQGNQMEVQAELSFVELPGENVTLRIMREGKPIARDRITLPQSGAQLQPYSVQLPTDDLEGLIQFEMVIDPVGNEVYLENNRYTFYVEVLKNKKNVVVFGHAPHPDIGALRSALLALEHYDVHMVFGSEGIPESIQPDIVVVHNTTLSPQVQTLLKSQNTGVLHFMGFRSDERSLGLDKAFNFSQRRTGFDRSRPAFLPQFSHFGLDAWWVDNGKSLPPLLTYFSRVELQPRSSIMAAAVIEGIQTERILIGTGYSGDAPTAVVNGLGWWNWRMHTFRETGRHTVFNDFVAQIFRFLGSVKREERLQLYHAPRYLEGRPVRIDARLYDAAFAPSTAGSIRFRMFADGQEKYTYDFTPGGEQYYLEIKGLPPGKYTYRAESELSGEKHLVSGSIVVEPYQAELMTTTANMEEMRRTATESGGQVFYHTGADAVFAALDEMEAKPILRERVKLSPLIDLWSLFALLLVFLTAEWFFRRRSGSY
jgi:hypothetical protein